MDPEAATGRSSAASRCVCAIAKENRRVRFSVSKVTAASFCLVFFFPLPPLRQEWVGAILMTAVLLFPTSLFNVRKKKNGHLCVIPRRRRRRLLQIARREEGRGEAGRKHVLPSFCDASCDLLCLIVCNTYPTAG